MVFHEKNEDMTWNSSRKEIEEWLSRKEEEFAQQETKNLRIDSHRWKQRYINFDLHENLKR